MEKFDSQRVMRLYISFYQLTLVYGNFLFEIYCLDIYEKSDD